MSDKLVHVNSYTRDDGTKVKEHYRGGDSNVENDGAEQTPLLLGGVSEDVYYPEEKGFLEKYSDAIEVVLSVAQMAGTLAQEGLRIASELRTADETSSVELGAKMEEVVGNMRQVHSLSVSTEQATLEKLSNTTNQREYKELYDTYVQQRELNQKNNFLLNRLEYSLHNSDYDDVINQLNQYNSNFSDVVKKIRNEQPTRLEIPSEMSYSGISTPVPTPYITPERHLLPTWGKMAIDIGMPLYDYYFDAPDAKEFWQASSNDFEYSKDYIQQNGALVYSTAELPSKELQNVVNRKLKEQLNIEDTVGIILRSDSRLSLEISYSPEFKEHFKKYAAEMIKGNVIKGTSLYLASSNNLAKTLGHVDVVYMYINPINKNLYALVFDTYDFNENENLPVEIARWAQEARYIRNFYSLNVISVSKTNWQVWLGEI